MNPENVATNYWSKRKDQPYYKQSEFYADTYCPNGKTLLDVGGGVGLGCRYLERFDRFEERVSVENWWVDGGEEFDLPGVDILRRDFLKWQHPQEKFDLVLCLQVLEHIPSPSVVRFARKLFQCGKCVIISVPHKWQKGRCVGHIQDPVDELKLFDWTGMTPNESVVVGERLVSVYADFG